MFFQNILISKVRKKLFYHVIVKIIWATFCENFDQNGKHVEIKQQAPQLTLLYVLGLSKAATWGVV